jgi:hypothetical protein
VKQNAASARSMKETCVSILPGKKMSSSSKKNNISPDVLLIPQFRVPPGPETNLDFVILTDGMNSNVASKSDSRKRFPRLRGVKGDEESTEMTISREWRSVPIEESAFCNDSTLWKKGITTLISIFLLTCSDALQPIFPDCRQVHLQTVQKFRGSF